MLQTQFAGTSISDNDSIIASPSCDTVSDSDEDSGDEFTFPLASEVISVNDLESIVSGEEPRAGKGPGRGKFSPGNVISPKRNETQDQNNNVWTKIPKTTKRTFSKIVEEKDVCPDHGTLCSKGICTVMQRRKREQEREMKRAERAAMRKLKNKSQPGGDSGGLRSGKKDGSGDDDDDDAKTEVGDDTRSVVTYSSRASASVASDSRNSLAGTDINTRSRGPAPSATGSIASSIRGDWGPRRSTFNLSSTGVISPITPKLQNGMQDTDSKIILLPSLVLSMQLSIQISQMIPFPYQTDSKPLPLVVQDLHMAEKARPSP